MGKWVEVRLMPDQYDLQDAILEHFQDVRHPTPRNMEPGMRLTVPYRKDAEEFLNGLGLTWKFLTKSEKLKGNKNAMIGEVGSTVVRIPSSLMDDLHKCLIIEEGEATTDKARIVEYAMTILENYTRNKIEHNETMML